MALPSLLPFLRSFLLSIEISGKEATLPFISTPLARANAEEHIRQLRASLRRLQRSPLTMNVRTSQAGPRLPIGQSRRASLAEAVLNVILGFWISVLANIWLLPLWGFHPSLPQGIEIGLLFTLISLVRSYLLRRLFNLLYIKTRSSAP